MPRRIFLHIGLPKTGTTYLQNILWSNKGLLADQGVLLPGATRRRHLLASLDLREDPKLARRSGNVAAPWQELVDEVNAWSGSTAVISHEFFAAASVSQIRRAVASFPDLELHVVVTGRDMVGLGLSRWQEWIKNGGVVEIDNYPDNRPYDPCDEWGWGSFDLAEVLDRWGAVLDHGRIHVLPVAVHGVGAVDLWHRFAAAIGVDPVGLNVPEEAANRSLGVVELELLRRVNARLVGFHSAGDRGRWIRDYLAGQILPRSTERFRASEQKVADLASRGQRAVTLLEEQGFDVMGRIDDLAPRSPGEVRRPQDVSDAELLEAATESIARLMSAVRSLTRERNALRDAPATLEEERKARVTVLRLLHRSKRK